MGVGDVLVGCLWLFVAEGPLMFGIDIKGTLWALAVVLLLLILMFRGCGNRMDKFREHRKERRQEREEKWESRRNERQERWSERREGRDFFDRDHRWFRDKQAKWIRES